MTLGGRVAPPPCSQSWDPQWREESPPRLPALERLVRPGPRDLVLVEFSVSEREDGKHFMTVGLAGGGEGEG